MEGRGGLREGKRGREGKVGNGEGREKGEVGRNSALVVGG